MPSISFRTFGCKVNQYETEQAAAQAAEAGLEVVHHQSPADIQIIHTCSITSAAVRDGRQAIRQAMRLAPGSRIIATGCAVQTDRDALLPYPESAETSDLATAVAMECETWGVSEQPKPDASECAGCTGRAQTRTRALLKIHDGCYFRCTFCIVPNARPVESSKPVDDAVAEAKAFVRAGHKEIVLTGVRITGYRPEGWGRRGLIELLSRLGEIEGLHRVRLTSLYPSEVRDDLLEAMASSPNCCHHLHLALQSGDDGILAAMGRKYTSAQFEEVVESARRWMPDVALTTDVICGFPGESEQAFANSRDLMRRVGFLRAHVFTYSPRPGTPGAQMPDAVPNEIARERTRELIAVAAESGLAIRKQMVGKVVRVIAESRKPGGRMAGLTEGYVEVEFDGPDDLTGRQVDVRVVDVDESLTLGEVACGEGGNG